MFKEVSLPDYIFLMKGKRTVALPRTDVAGANKLMVQGFEKQFEEVSAIDEIHALARLADIRKDKRIDQHNFRAGAVEMPWIGIMTAIASLFFRKK